MGGAARVLAGLKSLREKLVLGEEGITACAKNDVTGVRSSRTRCHSREACPRVGGERESTSLSCTLVDGVKALSFEGTRCHNRTHG